MLVREIKFFIILKKNYNIIYVYNKRPSMIDAIRKCL